MIVSTFTATDPEKFFRVGTSAYPFRGPIRIFGKVEFYSRVLAPPRPLLARWKNDDSMNWAEYVTAYESHLDTNAPAVLAEVSRIAALARAAGKTPALLCFCPDPEYCHRTILAVWLENHGLPEIQEL